MSDGDGLIPNEASSAADNVTWPTTNVTGFSYLPLLPIIFILVIAITGNVFVVASFMRDHRLRVIFNLFVMHLAVADIGMSSILLLVLTDIVGSFTLLNRSALLCQVCAMMANVFPVEQLVITHIMCKDRHQALLRRLAYPRRFPQWHSQKLLLLVTWMVSLVGGFLLTDLASVMNPAAFQLCKFPYRPVHVSFMSYLHLVLLLSLLVVVAWILWATRRKRVKRERSPVHRIGHGLPISYMSLNKKLEGDSSLQYLIPRSPTNIFKHFKLVETPEPKQRHLPETSPGPVFGLLTKPESPRTISSRSSDPPSLLSAPNPTPAGQVELSCERPSPISLRAFSYKALSPRSRQNVSSLLPFTSSRRREGKGVDLAEGSEGLLASRHRKSMPQTGQEECREERSESDNGTMVPDVKEIYGNNSEPSVLEDLCTLSGHDSELNDRAGDSCSENITDEWNSRAMESKDADIGNSKPSRGPVVERKSAMGKGKRDPRRRVRIFGSDARPAHGREGDVDPEELDNRMTQSAVSASDDCFPASSSSISDDEPLDLPIPRFRPRTDSLYTLRSCLSISEESLSQSTDDAKDVSMFSDESASQEDFDTSLKPSRERRHESKLFTIGDDNEEISSPVTDDTVRTKTASLNTLLSCFNISAGYISPRSSSSSEKAASPIGIRNDIATPSIDFDRVPGNEDKSDGCQNTAENSGIAEISNQSVTKELPSKINEKVGEKTSSPGNSEKDDPTGRQDHSARGTSKPSGYMNELFLSQDTRQSDRLVKESSLAGSDPLRESNEKNISNNLSEMENNNNKNEKIQQGGGTAEEEKKQSLDTSIDCKPAQQTEKRWDESSDTLPVSKPLDVNNSAGRKQLNKDRSNATQGGSKTGKSRWFQQHRKVLNSGTHKAESVQQMVQEREIQSAVEDWISFYGIQRVPRIVTSLSRILPAACMTRYVNPSPTLGYRDHKACHLPPDEQAASNSGTSTTTRSSLVVADNEDEHETPAGHSQGDLDHAIDKWIAFYDMNLPRRRHKFSAPGPSVVRHHSSPVHLPASEPRAESAWNTINGVVLKAKQILLEIYDIKQPAEGIPNLRYQENGHIVSVPVEVHASLDDYPEGSIATEPVAHRVRSRMNRSVLSRSLPTGVINAKVETVDETVKSKLVGSDAKARADDGMSQSSRSEHENRVTRSRPNADTVSHSTNPWANQPTDDHNLDADLPLQAQSLRAEVDKPPTLRPLSLKSPHVASLSQGINLDSETQHLPEASDKSFPWEYINAVQCDSARTECSLSLASSSSAYYTIRDAPEMCESSEHTLSERKAASHSADVVCPLSSMNAEASGQDASVPGEGIISYSRGSGEHVDVSKNISSHPGNSESDWYTLPVCGEAPKADNDGEDHITVTDNPHGDSCLCSVTTGRFDKIILDEHHTESDKLKMTDIEVASSLQKAKHGDVHAGDNEAYTRSEKESFSPRTDHDSSTIMYPADIKEVETSIDSMTSEPKKGHVVGNGLLHSPGTVYLAQDSFREITMTPREILESLSISRRAYLAELGMYHEILTGILPLEMLHFCECQESCYCCCVNCRKKALEKKVKASEAVAEHNCHSLEDAVVSGTYRVADRREENGTVRVQIDTLDLDNDVNQSKTLMSPGTRGGYKIERPRAEGQDRPLLPGASRAGRVYRADSRTVSGTTVYTVDDHIYFGSNSFLTAPRWTKRCPRVLKRLLGAASFDRLKTTDPELSILLSLLLIVFVQVVCWLPITILYLHYNIIGFPPVPSSQELVFVWLWCARMAIQPFLYSYYSKYFRQNYSQLLCCHCGRLRR